MRSFIHQTFLDHPKSVDETYFQHLMFATKFAGLLLIAGLAALVHAIVPALCERTASRIVTNLYSRIHNR